MAPDPQPLSFPSSQSLYRGQSSTGLGEGPGNPIRDGEQYLRGSDKELVQDADWSRAARPWMSFDADPADVQKLGDRLEGWSCTRIGPWQMIARLRPAGIYDRRTAYFTHGRFWRFAELPAAMDPGAHLGRAESFAAPFRGDPPPEEVELFPEMVRPEQINENQKAAVELLANLICALTSQKNLVVVAPTEEFATGSPFHALLSFARTALPAKLKSVCRVRIYTRNPELFLSRGSPEEAYLLAIPEWVSESAAAARRDAIFVDSQGRLRQGKGPDPAARSYATAVVGRAVRIPRGLVLFTERYSHWATKSVQHEQAIQIHYNLAFAFAKPQERAGELLKKYLLQKAQTLSALDWSTLIGDREWNLFPQEALFDLIFTPDSELKPGAIQLRQTVEQFVAHRQLNSRENFERWWESGNPAKEERLLQLVAAPTAVVPQDLARSFVTQIPVDRLAAMAGNPVLLEVLAQMSSTNQLPLDWFDRLMKSSPSELELVGIAGTLLRHAHAWQHWPKAPLKLLLDRLLDTADPQIYAGIVPGLLPASRKLDPISNAELLLRVVELAARSGQDVSMVLGSFRKSFTQIEPAARRFLVQAALSKEWHSVRPESLFSSGRLIAEWLDEFAIPILGCDLVRQDAPLEALLQLGKIAYAQGGELTAEFFKALDHRVRNHPEKSTGSLIRQGWWLTWRFRTTLDKELLRQVAFHWLSSEDWRSLSPPEAKLEDWQEVLRDVGDIKISTKETARLRRDSNDNPTWPWIPYFEMDQVEDLLACAQDSSVLAELAALAEKHPAIGHRAWDLAGQSPLLAGHLTGHALKHLLEKRQELPLSLADSELLFKNAGEYSARALDARRRSILHQLKSYRSPDSAHPKAAIEAIVAAASSGLWNDPKFLTGFAEWLNGLAEPAEPSDEILTVIRTCLPEGSRHESSRSFTAKAHALVERNFHDVGAFLSPGILEKARLKGLPHEISIALSGDRRDEECWNRLKSATLSWHQNEGAGEHPLRSIWREIQISSSDVGLRQQLRANGPATLVRKLAVEDRSYLLLPDRKGLPAVALLSALLGFGSRGMAAGAVMVSAAPTPYFRDETWWQALFHEIFSGSNAEDLPLTSMEYLLRVAHDHSPLMASTFETKAAIYSPRLHRSL